MIFLILAILSSSIISVLMRLSTDKISANLSMLAVNYLICAVLGAGYANFNVWAAHQSGFGTAVGLGVISGALYLAGFVKLQSNVRRNGVVLSSMFMKLGLLVPILTSVIFFGEVPTWLQISGFCIALSAIIMMNLKKEENPRGFSMGLIVLLLLGGGCDLMSKIYEMYGQPQLADPYLFYTFAAATLMCLILVIREKERPGIREIVFGTLIGIPNFFSAKFLLLALTKLPAVVVYPSFSVATLLVVTLTGVLAFKERLNKVQWGALAAIIMALILLNI